MNPEESLEDYVETEQSTEKDPGLDFSINDGIESDLVGDGVDEMFEEVTDSDGNDDLRESESDPVGSDAVSGFDPDESLPGDFLGYAYLVESETEAPETEEEINNYAVAVYSNLSAGHEVYGSYADLVLEHNGVDYTFLVPAAQLDKLIIDIADDGTMILINNSGSNVVLQGEINYSGSDPFDFYQLTIPASNLASSVYNYGGYCYLTTYYQSNNSIRSQNDYLSGTLIGSLSTDNLSSDYTSQPEFYSFVMAMLLLIAAFVSGLFWKWKVRTID